MCAGAGSGCVTAMVVGGCCISEVGMEEGPGRTEGCGG